LDYEELVELKKRFEFNKTESRILLELVRKANRIGERFQKENVRLKKRARGIFDEISKIEEFLFTEDNLPDNNFTDCCTVGIDGSFYLIGGTGGKWYAPYSIVRILFENGIESPPQVDIYAAGIEEISEQKDFNVEMAAALRMLVGETKAIENWSNKKKSSLIFIDGPIADPPFYKDKHYIEDRSNAIKKCLRNSRVIGCVKKSRERFFIKEFESISKKSFDDFPSDQYLFTYLFSAFRHKNKYNGALYSKFLDISDYETTYQLYKEQGIHVCSGFFQKSIDSKILRLDIPLLKGKLKQNKIYCDAVKATLDWQYPKQYIPLPIELAHQKCKIREGAAEVLYEEIISKSRSGDLEDQINLFQLR